MKTVVSVLMAALAIATTARAQTPVAPPAATAPAAVPAPAPGAAPVAPGAPAVPAAPAVIPVGTRVGVGLTLPTGYDADNRRDPFLSLVQRRLAAGPAGMTMGGAPRTGLAAVPVADVVVRGITKAGTRMLAILEAPNKQSFVAKAQDKLLDAAIKSIDAAGVVFVEPAGDEVRKTLRPMGEVIR